MISFAREDGTLIKSLLEVTTTDAQCYGYHRQFGLIREDLVGRREQTRRFHGLRVADQPWLFKFGVQRNVSQAEGEVSPHEKNNNFDHESMIVTAAQGCTVEPGAKGEWILKTSLGSFKVTSSAVIDRSEIIRESKESQPWKSFAAVFCLMLLLFPFLTTKKIEPVVPQVIEPVTVTVIPERQRSVSVPVPQNLEALPEIQKSREVKRAIQQNLGFLGLLGRKDLKNAVGGLPSNVAHVSPGAGPGGAGGSGGELLIGLGEGVKRTTVGNSGVKGLGGIGTKGAGGGAGGYGNSLVASGEAKALSSLALTDDIVLEGGLDRGVIQATIAKYISQVRACYEEGLQKNSGLGGQVTMNFEIGPSGSLNYVRVSKSSLGSPDVENCISRKMASWMFPKPVGGVNVKVNYPFVLRPVG